MQTFEKGRKREDCLKYLSGIIQDLDKVLEDNKVPEFRKEWTRELISVIGLAISFVPEKAKKYNVVDDRKDFDSLKRTYVKTEDSFCVSNKRVAIAKGYQKISSYPKIYDVIILVDSSIDDAYNVFEALNGAFGDAARRNLVF